MHKAGILTWQFGNLYDNPAIPLWLLQQYHITETDKLTYIETQITLKQYLVTMGTPQTIDIKTYADSTGVFETRPLVNESVLKATELLNINHENYHIYIHNLGLHSMQVDLTEKAE